MKIALIGNGAISQFVQSHAQTAGVELACILVRPNRVEAGNAVPLISRLRDIPEDVRVVVDCAGHDALRSFGAEVLLTGRQLVTVSIGALADNALYQSLLAAAQKGGGALFLASGAIGALDCLQAAGVGRLTTVNYIGRKPPQGWKGSAAEQVLDLDALTKDAKAHFTGSARDAALAYPKNANVAAAVALAGVGFDKTQVNLIADPSVTDNIHEIHAEGDFGSFQFQISGKTLPDNPKSSALAAMSVVARLAALAQPIRF